MSAALIPMAFAMRPRSRRFAPNSAARCAIQAKFGSPPALSTVTVTGPIPSCSVASTLGESSAISPRLASSHVVPTVGCPAIGISCDGVKIRTRRAPEDSGGITKVDSLKFISCANSCISLALSAAPSVKTASWLPPNGLEVKTSTRVNGIFLGIRKFCRDAPCEPIGNEKRRAVEGPPLREFGKWERLLADDEDAAGGAAAADIQHRELLRVLDLVIAGAARDLAMAIEHLPHARRADRMTRADKAAAWIDRQLAAKLDHAFLDRLPRLARLGDAEVIDRHVLGGREAIVRLDSRQLGHRAEAGAFERVDDRLARVRQHVGVVAALQHLGVEFERRGVMAPTEDARNVAELLAVALGPRARELFRGEENGDRAVGDLRAIAHLDAAADDRVKLALALRVALAHEPVASLRVRIALGVGVVDRGDVREVLVLQAVTLVVLVAEAAEQFWEWELDSLGLALVPRRGAEIVAAGGRIDGLH